MKWVEIGLLGFLTACTPREPPTKSRPASEQDLQPEGPAPLQETAVAQSLTIVHDLELVSSVGSRSHGGGYLLERPRLTMTNHGQGPHVVSIATVALRSTLPSTRQVGRLAQVVVDGEDVRFPLELAAGESVELRLRIEDVVGAYHRRFWYEFEVLVDGEVRPVTSDPVDYRAPRRSRRSPLGAASPRYR